MSSGRRTVNDPKLYVASSGAGRIKSLTETHHHKDSSLGPLASTAANDPLNASHRRTEELLATMLERMNELTQFTRAISKRVDALESQKYAVPDARHNLGRGDSPQKLSEQTANYSITHAN